MLSEKRVLYCLVVLFAMFAVGDVATFAQGASPSYRIDESFIGTGSNVESNSSGYRLEAGQQAVGSPGSVNASSTTYQTHGGPVTASEPTLSCVVETTNVNFGDFSPAVSRTATATFRVRNYTSYGYNVSIIGNPPSNSGHTLAGMNPSANSQTGTEQFGINLVANTLPTTFGAAPEQIPDSSFSFGAANSNYNTTNTFRYVPGEAIASAPKSSGETRFTISYLVNVSTTTPGGKYSANNAILCTGTY